MARSLADEPRHRVGRVWEDSNEELRSEGDRRFGQTAVGVRNAGRDLVETASGRERLAGELTPFGGERLGADREQARGGVWAA